MKKSNEIVIQDINSISVELSRDFTDEYLDVEENPILLLQPIVVTDLLFKIMTDLKGNMFRTSNKHLFDPKEISQNQMKMDLWESEVLNTDKNVLMKAYKTSYFLKNRNKVLMTKALDFLKTYKHSIYTFQNSEGEKLTTSGGLIKDWNFLDKSGVFQVEISLYWADRIVRLQPEKWNNLRTDILSSIKNIKHRFFITWLIRIKKNKGTAIGWMKLAKRYGLNYSNKYDFIRGFLMPLKSVLDNKEINGTWISFAYYDVPEKPNQIKIVPYDVRPEEFAKLKPEGKVVIQNNRLDNERNEINYQSKYLKRRHELSEANIKAFKESTIKPDILAFKVSYKKFISEIRKEGKKATDFLDVDFIEKWKKLYS
ncbi:MAG: hypothetical protein V3U92_02040 [Cellulophaga sp.]